MVDRPSWDRYFMDIAAMVATRSTCMRRSVGAIAVNNRRILATGYNGTPKGLRHCTEVGCIRQELGIPSGQRHELCRGLHAEQNCIIQAAVHGVQLDGSTIYCTFQPCVVCAKMLINAGISEVVYEGGYPDEMAVSMLNEAGVKLRRLEPEAEVGG
jgi:dCMP deaminase